VRKIIKSKLKELHLLEISHNDVRRANIHVSVPGKISFIGFELSGCTMKKVKKNDFESLDTIVNEDHFNVPFFKKILLMALKI
jgi:predicted unusual protein kinase regulating ubiquinone biosynthesis (AarF/ABC1/UbiB family)